MAQIQIRKAQRSQSKLRIGLAGPSGSGKTMSSLKLARGIAGPSGRILMIDTERGSGDLYSHITDYDIITLEAPFAPKNYIDAIEAGEDAGYDVIIIDSLSHAWADEGGLLDQADKLSKSSNRFSVWQDLTPQHRKLVGALLNSDAHIIGTVRSKQDYALEEYTDAKGSKKQRPVKMGLAPVQREGMEYEFTVFIDIEQNHIAHTSKDRTDLFKDEVFVIDEKTGERLMGWLKEAKPTDKGQTHREGRLAGKKGQIMGLAKSIASTTGAVPQTAEEYAAIVLRVTQLELTEANYDEIIGRLKVRFDELVEAHMLDRTGRALNVQPKAETTIAVMKADNVLPQKNN